MKTVEFLGHQISKVILGDNPFFGNSYVPDTYPRKEMYDFYQVEQIQNALFTAEENGMTTYMALADNYLIRMYELYRRNGGKMNIMFQTMPPYDLQANIWEMIKCEPIAVYHQGSTAEEFLRDDKKDVLLQRLELLRTMKIYVGLGTHVPEILLQAERENWGLDFYMTCLYNYQNQRKGVRSGFFADKSIPKYVTFYPEDPAKMYAAIKQVNKPCIAFKIFAGGQVFNDKAPEEIPGVLENVFTDVFTNIKPNDVACIGVYQKFKDQIKENVEIANKVLG